MRVNKIFIYVGTRGTGKTDFVKNLIDHFPQPKTLIVDIAENPAWANMETHNHPEWASRKIPIMPLEKLPYHKSGIYHIYHDDITLLEQMIFEHVVNTSLIIEDATQWYNATLTKAQKRYLLRSKQLNCDYHIVFHTLSSVPPELIKYSDYLTIFKTGEITFNNKKFYQPSFEKIFKEVYNSQDPYINRTIRLK
jgi:hypothetical protein